jgi:hypothetical protein
MGGAADCVGVPADLPRRLQHRVSVSARADPGLGPGVGRNGIVSPPKPQAHAWDAVDTSMGCTARSDGRVATFSNGTGTWIETASDACPATAHLRRPPWVHPSTSHQAGA